MLTRVIVIRADEGLHESSWNRVEDALADAELTGALVAKVREALKLPAELDELIEVTVQ